MAQIYIPFYSRYGNIETMAIAVGEGITEAGGEAVLAYVGDTITPPEVMKNDARWQATHERLMEQYPLAAIDALAAADGAAFGTPTRFGNMAAQMKNYIDMMAPLWLNGALIDKPAGVFVSTATLHGGQETTQLTTWVPLVHLGMIIVGVPYSVPELMSTTTGGAPYGPSHVAGGGSDIPVDTNELAVARALGSRLAKIAAALKTAPA